MPSKTASPRSRNFARAAAMLLIALYVALRARHMLAYSLWWDEAFSASLAPSSWRELFHQVLLDRIHPPLFYILLKLWSVVCGSSLFALRLFSVVCSVLALAPLIAIGRRLLPPEIALALLFALATNTYLAQFLSQEVRMYALLLLLSSLSMWAYLRMLREGSRASSSLWIIVNILLVLTHLAGGVVVLWECIHLALRHPALKKHRWTPTLLIGAPASVIALIAWYAAVAHYVGLSRTALARNVAWIPHASAAHMLKSATHLLGGSVPALVLCAPILVAAVRFRPRANSTALLFALLSFGTVLILLLFSFSISPVWQERYLIVCVAPFYLLLGLALSRFATRTRRMWIGVVCLCAFANLVQDLTHHVDRPDFSALSHLPSAEPIFGSDDATAAPLDYLRRQHGDEGVKVLEAAMRAPTGLHLISRTPAYSIGQSGEGRAAPTTAGSSFVFVVDVSEVPQNGAAGIEPADLLALHCSLNELGHTRGQGHRFTFLRVECP